ncbi:uncharacterized protein LAESUDRAFT_755872 [Laetiporus sulphureus 93-53]|uniref:SNF2 family DNA-dependent ATPase domain-containing protein n=1 Tax=Laetiporus sulphureus 93-53 TaxID=1314785 RepID=A0A165GHP5_9APHY|nr:uncharacterized protein LAESUDRAFT_755872 [Laetiporus sulphureus 93-53]KZT10363.1 hypothetical protein LAESUDRAFT_755872 [Laetiporus sulphureus 93-53]
MNLHALHGARLMGGPSVNLPPVSGNVAISMQHPPTTQPGKRTLRGSENAVLGEGAMQSPKRVKLESPTKPFALSNRNPSMLQSSTPPSPQPSTADTHEMLADVQMRIDDVQTLLKMTLRKYPQTKADSTMIASFNKELEELRLRKEKCTASISRSAPVAPPACIRADATVSAFLPASIRVEEATQVLPHGYVKAGVNPIVMDYSAASQPAASGSNVRLPSAYDRDAYLRGLRTHGDIKRGDTRDGDSEDDKVLHSLDEHSGEDGNFYGRGCDRFAGPIARADDIDKFLVAAGNAEQFDGNASVDEALEKLGLDNQYMPLPGMEIALMPHQTIGVAWMLGKEKSSYRGGCMSDEMGLGKTVQMIAVMVANQSEDPLCKTNLIVAPLALLDQWKLEIEEKTRCDLKCLVYHGLNKPTKLNELKKYDIILTTFQVTFFALFIRHSYAHKAKTLALEWPDEEAKEKIAKRKAKRQSKVDDFIDGDSDDAQTFKRKRKSQGNGLLLQMTWYRVIVDEAQNIRNRRTRISRAVTQLQSKYRWCLTGTPIINSLTDAYGLLRFLRIRPWYDWDEFNGHIAKHEKKQPTLATARLQTIFVSMLLRRKKDSMLDGKRLIELPSKEVILTKLQFSLEERDIYKMVEAKSQAIFNRFLRAGTVLKNYHQVLVLLLRLRQICCHPCLIQEESMAFVTAHELEDANHGKRYELSRARQLISPEFVTNMQNKMQEIMLQRMEAEKQSADATIDDEECPICFDAFTDPVVTPCAHVFCRECMTNIFNTEPIDNGDENKLFSRAAFEPCDDDIDGGPADYTDESFDLSAMFDARPKLGRTLRNRKPQKRRVYDSEDDSEHEDEDDGLSDFIVEDDEDKKEKCARHARKKRLGKRRVVVLSSEDELDVEDDVICGAKPDIEVPPEQIKLMPRFLPSTKMKHMMETLKAWAEAHLDEKTLIISQWTHCLQLVSDYLSENGFLHVKYQGDMNRQKREQAVRVFMSKDKATILLMSLKCGGVGLNLTRANRVISLDLGWSEAIESQAFDRVHRLGQSRPVYVHRLVIADTVEDRVLALQERKKNLADGSLGEGNGKKIGRLSVRQLANLFGLDHRGNLLSQN